MPAEAITDSLAATDGFSLGVTYYPAAEARAAVLINGATAVPQGYYKRFARHLQGHGVSLLTYDYRGIGASRQGPLRKFAATMTDWAQRDARAAYHEIRRRAPNVPLVLVGHSFGGQLLGLVDELRDVDGAMLVGAQLGYFGDWPLGARLRYMFLWYAVMPAIVRAFGYVPGRFGLGADLPGGVALEWASWCRRPGYYLNDHPDAAARLASFTAPLLVYSFTDDDYAPPGAVDALIDRLPPSTHRRIAPRDLGVRAIGHFGFFRQRFAETLWPAALDFILSRRRD